MKWIYKLTFPNGTIYVGMDLSTTMSVSTARMSPSSSSPSATSCRAWRKTVLAYW
jgi:hypothetical protein